MKQQTKFKQTEIGLIPEDWEVTELGEVFNLSQGLQISSKIRIPTKKEGYIPLLKITDLPNEKFSEFVSLNDVRQNYISSKEDIIYTRTGQVGLVYTNVEGCVHNNCFKIHYDKKDFDKAFVYYMLKQKRIFQYANSVAGGSVQKDLSHPAFKSCIIAFPKNKQEQIEIGKILSDLDSKIGLNQQMNKTLEAIGQAIFKHWFIDFEFPNEEGKPYKSSGGEMVALKWGSIPKGWRLGCLGDIAENPRRGIQPETVERGTPYIGLEHMPRRSIAISDWETVEEVVSNKFQFNQGEILFGKLRPYFHKVGVAPVNGVCSTDILVIVPKSPEWYGFILGHVSSEEFVNYADAVSTGTRMPRANWEDMARYEILIPTNSVSLAFNGTVVSLLQKITANILQSRTLAAIRDPLLPKLMSGKIRVPVEVQT